MCFPVSELAGDEGVMKKLYEGVMQELHTLKEREPKVVIKFAANVDGLLDGDEMHSSDDVNEAKREREEGQQCNVRGGLQFTMGMNHGRWAFSTSECTWQLPILEDEAIGGFVTHCGWNSILEGVSAGVPMITWPVGAEQFYNEKLITQVLRTGLVVGSQQWTSFADKKKEASVKREAIEKAITQVMVGDEADELRSRAKALEEMARRAVEEGGSSFSDLTALVEELRRSVGA
ncbi:hypothetical protein ACFX11_035035 [Malus domestica]